MEKKWEYKIVEVRETIGKNDGLLNTLRGEGWELVSFEVRRDLQGNWRAYLAIFKKEKKEKV